MSTRSTTHFVNSQFINPVTKLPYLSAIIYRHSDGYPEGAGLDLFKFLKRCKKLKDSRLTDSSFLSARYVVFLGEMFAVDWMKRDANGKPKSNKDRLDFISVGVMMQDPLDIEYRYVVDCGNIGMNDLPTVTCFKVCVNEDGTDSYCIETSIPIRRQRTIKRKKCKKYQINFASLLMPEPL